NWGSHGNEKAFQRARGAIENADVGYDVLGGLHSQTGDDGAANRSRTDLDYVADELRRISRGRPADRVKWLEVVMALKRRAWSSSHEAGWATRRYRRKIGCTVALDATHGYDMSIGGYWVEGEPGGAPGAWDVVGTREARLRLPRVRGGGLRVALELSLDLGLMVRWRLTVAGMAAAGVGREFWKL